MENIKHEKFKRIADKRLENFKVSAERLSRVFNKLYFDYSPEEREFIKKEVEKATSKIFN